MTDYLRVLQHLIRYLRGFSLCVTAMSEIYYSGLYLSNEVILYQLSPLTLQVTAIQAIAHISFQVRLCHKLYRFVKTDLRIVAQVGA